MITNRFVTLLTIIITITLYAFAAQADPGKRWPGAKKWKKEQPRYASQDKRGFILDHRYRHNRYYPKRGYSVKVLPQGCRPILYRNARYYFHGGIWYRAHQQRFRVILPPVGLTLAFLPEFYTTLWVGGLPYYYAAGAYYRWLPRERVYVVSDPPAESDVIEQPEMPDQLFIYPKEGQSEEQQADDRYECHRWSVDQTGFDPIQSGGNVPERLYDSKKADYQRAMKACLESRGYSVQ